MPNEDNKIINADLECLLVIIIQKNHQQLK